MSALAGMSEAEIRAFMAEAKAMLSDVETVRRQELGVVGEEFLTHFITQTPLTKSPTSAWAGHAESQIPVTHDGRAYMVRIVVTDTAETEARVDGTPEQVAAGLAHFTSAAKKKEAEAAAKATARAALAGKDAATIAAMLAEQAATLASS